MAETIKAVVKNHIDTSANLASDNIIPYEGEVTFESDTLQFKVGDGTSNYNDLPYTITTNGSDIIEITDAVDVVTALPDPATVVGTLKYGRYGTGTGKRTFNCPVGCNLQWADGSTTTTVDMKGSGNMSLVAKGTDFWIEDYSDYPTDSGSVEAQKHVCKAWVNFNGTGVVSIRDSFNVSSITDNGVGDYTVNFENAMNDENYSVISTGHGDSALRTGTLSVKYGTNPTINNVILNNMSNAGGANIIKDGAILSVSIFGS
jgi:hypothetical protein